MLTPIFNKETGAGGTPSQREWSRLLLSSASSSRDGNATLVSLAEDDTGSTVTVAGGTATDMPTDGVTYFFPLTDSNGSQVTATDFYDTKLFIDVITAPANETDLYATIGIFTSTDASSGLYGGLVYDLATGPDLRTGNTAANSDDGANATNAKAVVEVTALGSTLRLVSGYSYTAANAPVFYGQRSGNIPASSAPLYVGVSIGRKTAIAGSAAIKFKAYALDFTKATGFPA